MSEATPAGELSARELFDLRGRVALVTGGATGIGWQMACGLAEMGADVALCGRDGERAERAAAELAQRSGGRALGLRCDVADAADVTALVAAVGERLGPLDVLVNNSGTTWGAPAEDHPLEGWQKVIGVNLTGTFLCAQAAARTMLDGRGGKIVNIASAAGLRGAPPEIRQSAAYSASKGGVIALTRDLATAWAGRGVTVNALAPGWFPSAMAEKVLDERRERVLATIPLRRFGSAHDLKGAVVFLASRASDYVTGQVLPVDGGKTAW